MTIDLKTIDELLQRIADEKEDLNFQQLGIKYYLNFCVQKYKDFTEEAMKRLQFKRKLLKVNMKALQNKQFDLIKLRESVVKSQEVG